MKILQIKILFCIAKEPSEENQEAKTHSFINKPIRAERIPKTFRYLKSNLLSTLSIPLFCSLLKKDKLKELTIDWDKKPICATQIKNTGKRTISYLGL